MKVNDSEGIYIYIECSFLTDDHRKGSPWIQMHKIDSEFVWEKPDQARWLMPNVHVDAKSTVCTHKNDKQPTPYLIVRGWKDMKRVYIYKFVDMIFLWSSDHFEILAPGDMMCQTFKVKCGRKQPFFFGWGAGGTSIPPRQQCKVELNGNPVLKALILLGSTV